jgi:hypothetical protein
MAQNMTLPLPALENTLQSMIDNFLSLDCWCHLLKAVPAGGDTATLAQCLAAEATFIGYSAQQVLGWTAASGSVIQNPQSFASAEFIPTGPGGTGTIQGYFLCNLAQTRYYGLSIYTGALPSTDTGIPYDVSIAYQLGSIF